MLKTMVMASLDFQSTLKTSANQNTLLAMVAMSNFPPAPKTQLCKVPPTEYSCQTSWVPMGHVVLEKIT